MDDGFRLEVGKLDIVGLKLGLNDTEGFELGSPEGFVDGISDDSKLGDVEGSKLTVGSKEGNVVGTAVGGPVGTEVGNDVGDGEGPSVGIEVGINDGDKDGELDGVPEGLREG